VYDRLALGTAQFGLFYGVSNVYGQPTAAECKSILSYAKSVGVQTLDTAIAYGSSEEVLGGIGIQDWQVVTKLPAMPDGIVDVDGWVESQLFHSLCRLGVKSLHGLLLHQPNQLLSDRGQDLYCSMLKHRDLGIVKKIGISIYSPVELEQIPSVMHFDIVQAPLNILDRRMILTGWADRLMEKGIEFHARSIFLQGVLLMSSHERAEKFKPWNKLWKIWDAWLKSNKLSAVDVCLSYALKTEQITKLVIGVTNLSELREILSNIKSDLPDPPVELMTQDIKLLNPSLWTKI
jgi:aryl-alcohol dehydrogenase-like predicted oxidoreductase